MTDNGWPEYSKHVMAELERLQKGQERIREEMVRVRECVATLKVKASLWGGLAGIIPVALLLIWEMTSG